MPFIKKPFHGKPGTRGPGGARKPGGGFSSRPGGGHGRPSSREDGPGGGKFFRKKINRFYTVFSEKAAAVDFKDIERLSRFLTERGKIMPRRITGLTAKQQRMVSGAIKRARHAGLLAFQSE